jgi:hypothetical protein
MSRVPPAGELSTGRTVVEVVIFRSVIVALDEGGHVTIALFNGTPESCVGVFKASIDTAGALWRALGSTLNIEGR